MVGAAVGVVVVVILTIAGCVYFENRLSRLEDRVFEIIKEINNERQARRNGPGAKA